MCRLMVENITVPLSKSLIASTRTDVKDYRYSQEGRESGRRRPNHKSFGSPLDVTTAIPLPMVKNKML